jgi:VWFA-related protein
VRRIGLQSVLAVSILSIAAIPAPAQSRTLVKLNLVATDSKGAPVTDLSAKDIVVREDGAVHPLVFFRFAGGRPAMSQTGTNEFANRSGPPVTVILLDRWNQRELTLATAWQDIATALGHYENVDRLYLYFLGNQADLVPVQPLPGPEADLRMPPPLSATALIARFNQTVRSLTGLRDMANVDPMDRAERTLQALHIVSQMGNIAGPKSLVWVTHGFPIQFLNMSQQLLDYTQPLLGAAAAAVQSQVSIYTVDQSDEGAGADPAGLARQTLELISEQTGGRWFTSGRTADALAAVSNDTRGMYQLAYLPQATAKKSKDHKLRVESLRKGVRLLARAGFTGDEPTANPDEIMEDVLTRQSHSPFDATEIGLRVGRSEKPQGVHLEIHIDAADLYLEHRDDGDHGSLGLQLASYREGVCEATQPATRKDLALTQAEYDNAMKNGLAISSDIKVADGIQQLRVMVFDRGIQGLGSVTLPAK